MSGLFSRLYGWLGATSAATWLAAAGIGVMISLAVALWWEEGRLADRDRALGMLAGERDQALAAAAANAAEAIQIKAVYEQAIIAVQADAARREARLTFFAQAKEAVHAAPKPIPGCPVTSPGFAAAFDQLRVRQASGVD